MFIFLKTKNNFAGECVRQHNTEKNSRQWDYMLQTKKVSDWINWCNISWHPALFPLELISPEGSHHKPCLSGQIYPQRNYLYSLKGKAQKCFWHCQNNIFGLVHTKTELSSELSMAEPKTSFFLPVWGDSITHPTAQVLTGAQKIK